MYGPDAVATAVVTIDPRRRPSMRGMAAGARTHLREPLFRNAYALMFSTVMTGVLGFAFWALAARRYPTSVVGENAALIAAMMTVSTFAQLDLAWMLMRFLPRWRAIAGRSVALAYAVASAAAVVISVGFVLIASRVSDHFAFLSGWGVSIAFCASVVVWGVFAIQDGVLTGLGRAVVVPVENTTFAGAKLVLLLSISTIMPAWGIFSAWVVPVAVSIVPINYLIFRKYLPVHQKRPPHPEVLDRTTVTRYVAYDYAGGLCGALVTIAMPLIVTGRLGADAGAIFYVAWTIVLVFDSIALSLGSSLLVEGSFDPTRLADHSRRIARRGALLLLPIIVAIVVLAPLVLAIFGPEYSEESTPVLRLLALGLLPRAVIIFFTSVARVRGEVRFVLVVVVATTALILVLVYLLSARFGLMGFAAGWVLGYSIPALAICPLVRNMVRDEVVA